MSTLLSGYLDRSGAWIVPNLRTAERFDPQARLARAVPYGGTGASGILDATGTWIVPPCRYVGDWRDGVATFNVGGALDDDGNVVGGAWGIAGLGRVLSAARFEYLGGHCKDRIPFRAGDRWGYVDARGEVVVPAHFDRTWVFSDDCVGIAATADGEGYVLADGSWRLAPSGRFSSLLNPVDGRGWGRTDDGLVMIDLDGAILSAPVARVWAHAGGMAVVARDDEWYVLGPDGQVLGDGGGFADVRAPTGGLVPVSREDGAWFLLDARGAMHGPWKNVFVATEGLARVVDDDGAIGFFSARGELAIPHRYQDARGFAGGRAAVERDGAWTFVDTGGREIAPPSWDAASTFSEGLAIVRRGADSGAIDAEGRVVIEPRFTTIDAFSGGLAAARRVTFAPISPPPPEWHVTPRGGLTFAGFAGASALDDLRVTIAMRGKGLLDHAGALPAQQLLASWIAVADYLAGGDAIRAHSKWVADYAITLRFGGVPDPVALAAVLLDELRAIDLPIQDVTLGRYRSTDDPALALVTGYRAVPHPDDAGGPSMFDDFASYAAQAFDRSAIAPASESTQQLVAGRWNPQAEELAFDERIFTLHHPDVRICYGITQDGFVDPDERTGAIARGVTAALAARFDGIWFYPPRSYEGPPAPFMRDGDPGVEPIALEVGDRTRRGYCFALSTQRLIQDVGPTTFRWREPELMEALAQAVKELELEPVVMWQRFGDPLPGLTYPGWAHPMDPTVYVINLWEKA